MHLAIATIARESNRDDVENNWTLLGKNNRDRDRCYALEAALLPYCCKNVVPFYSGVAFATSCLPMATGLLLDKCRAMGHGYGPGLDK